MKKTQILIIPSSGKSTRHVHVPRWLGKVVLPVLSITCASTGYFVSDYLAMSQEREKFRQTFQEYQHLQTESQLVMENLEQLRQSLRKVEEFGNNLENLVNTQVKRVVKKTGIGPLTREEDSVFRQKKKLPQLALNVPLGIKIDQLYFRPLLADVRNVKQKSDFQAMQMEGLLETLATKKSLLQAIPSILPANGWLTSSFGKRRSPFTGKMVRHRGIDVAAPPGTPIFAAADGIIVFSGKKSGFGNFVVISHGNGIVTRYGHNRKNHVKAGQTVSRGDKIAEVGSTGRSTGPHLHYEVWVDGRAVNPRKFVLNSKNEFSFL